MPFHFVDREPTQPLMAVDLYCGCGGVTEGLKSASFRVIAAVDSDPIACKTYRDNHPEVELFERDIRKVYPKDIMALLPPNARLDLLVVCAPCQPFSSLNKAKSEGDSRTNLILESIRFARVLKPYVIFFENVPGIARHEGLLQELRDKLSKLGYRLGDPVRIDAADYGVPQRRLRCVMLATKGVNVPALPSPTTPEGFRKTVFEAIGSLAPLKAGEADEADQLHTARRHSDIALRRLSEIPKDGGSRFSLPESLQLKCHIEHDGHPDVYGRMAWHSVSPTLTTGCTDVTKGRFAHPEQNRAITMREAALLQTFPRRYSFKGNPSEVSRQIGNAVPVELVKALAPTFGMVAKEARMREIHRQSAKGNKS